MMFVRSWKLSLLVVLAGVTAACGTDKVVDKEHVATSEDELHSGGGGGNPDRVGLSLWFENGAVRLENGAPKTLVLYGDADRYVQELDITASFDSTTDLGITPITQSGDMARLDWRGVEVVDEDWRPEIGTFPKTYTRSRFYRNAKWMKKSSEFKVTALDHRDRRTGSPISLKAGGDDKLRESDDGFVRRFDARQITRGCPAIGDCTGATAFTAQGLMQVRDALHPERRAERIPMDAKKLEISWSEDPTNKRIVNIERKSLSQTPYAYGLEVDVDVISTPANSKYYVPGEVVDYRITYKDGSRSRLHPAGQLPSYADFATDNIASGIRYYDGFQQTLTLYYALKHREGNTIWNFSGPSSKLRYSSHVVSDQDFFFLSGTPGHITTATVAENGFSALFDIVPSVAGTLDPVLSTQPNSDVVHVTVPADAQPGTYVFAFKGRRDWGGEALNATGTADVQVGQKQKTEWVPKTGPCNTCHQDQSGLDKVLHATSDRRTCFGCHMPLESEPDQALDYRIHLIHTRSDRVAMNPNNCSNCHLTPPQGPARGFPGVGY